MASLGPDANDGSERANLPPMIKINVPHVQQHFNWDCGLACTKMILRYFGIPDDDFQTVANKLGFGTSVWTIDLANILAHYRVKHQFFTVTMGVDQGYSKKSFYKRSFTNDEKRINDLFSTPEELGISVQQGKVNLEYTLTHLAFGNTAIFLIDWSKLDCRWCNRKCLPSVKLNCLSSYQGHFIVVVGYDNKDQTIFYKNPSLKKELCCCSMKTFETARKSYGTDEDVIFIYHEAAALESGLS